MTVIHPVSDLAVWVRFMFAVSCVLVLPGYFAMGHFFSRIDRSTQFLISTAFGLLMVPPLAGMISFFGFPLIPAVYIPLALAFGLVVRRFLNSGNRFEEICADWQPWRASIQALLLVACLVSAVIVIWGFRDFPVPPTVHDATNHSLMTRQIYTTESSRLDDVFGLPYGSPSVLYLVGWHTSAALIAHLSGLAPYICTWLLPLFCLILLPLSWALLWRLFELPLIAVVVGAFLVHASRFVPMGCLNWGGFGLLVGMFSVPLMVILVFHFIRRMNFWTGAIAGIACASILHIHASEFVAVLFFTAVAVATRIQRKERFQWSILGLVSFLGFLTLGAGPGLWEIANSYVAGNKMAAVHPVGDLWQGLKYVRTMAGDFFLLQVLLGLGMISAFLRKPQRCLAVGVCSVMILCFLFLVFGDPVTSFLFKPFYREIGRVRAMLFMVLPAILALPSVFLLPIWQRNSNLWKSIVAAGLVVAVVGLTWPGLNQIRMDFRGKGLRNWTQFSDADYEMAKRIKQGTAPKDRIANYWDDGSAWLLHISKRSLTEPCGWRMGKKERVFKRRAVIGLNWDHWPAETWNLQQSGVKYLFISDTHLRKPAHPFLQENFDEDDRFEKIIQGDGSALYSILWDKQQRKQRVFYTKGWGDEESWGRWALEQTVNIKVDLAKKPRKIVFVSGRFDGQTDAQKGEVFWGEKSLGVFEVDGPNWAMKDYVVDLPTDLTKREIELTIRFSGQWPGNAQDQRIRTCPMKDIYLIY